MVKTFILLQFQSYKQWTCGAAIETRKPS